MKFDLFEKKVSSIKSDVVQFLKPGVQKYLVRIKGENMVNTMLLKTTTEIKWQLTVKEITNTGYIVELLTLSHDLVDTNNEGYWQLHLMIKQLNKLYERLLVRISADGIIEEILNETEVIENFKKIRREIIATQGDGFKLEDYMNFDDRLFFQKENLLKLSKELEFFKWYFLGLYGRKPVSSCSLQEENVFRTNQLNWLKRSIPVDTEESEKFIVVKSTFELTEKISKKWAEKAYGGFPFLKKETLEPQLKQEAKQWINKHNGFLEEMRYTTVEIADPLHLYNQMQVHLQATD
jgi:hypothetical protein